MNNITLVRDRDKKYKILIENIHAGDEVIIKSGSKEDLMQFLKIRKMNLKLRISEVENIEDTLRNSSLYVH